MKVASNLLQVDLRATSITAHSVICVFQSCPSMVSLDVGECQSLDLSILAERLEKVPLESLLVKHLEYMEVCGTGSGDLWIGYRQQLAADGNDKYRYSCIQRSYERPHIIGGPAKELGPEGARKRQLHSVGSRVKGVIDRIEAAIRQVQGRESYIFSMAINVCEECCRNFADWFPLDGHHDRFNTVEKRLLHRQTYGKHTCQAPGCTKSLFLCLDCMDNMFHYCADYECKACYCVDCDTANGMSVSIVWESEGEEAWEHLQATGTRHFRLVACAYDQWGTCPLPIQRKILCKEPHHETCEASESLCNRCGSWTCHYNEENDDVVYCDRLGCKNRTCPDCTEVHFCQHCESWLCDDCGHCEFCELCQETHCASCRVELHPPPPPAPNESEDDAGLNAEAENAETGGEQGDDGEE